MPSPIHRDPEEDGDDYGCFTAAANEAVSAVVKHVKLHLRHHVLTTADEVVDYVRTRLRKIGEGACDTVVKENVFYALDEDLKKANIAVGYEIYGW